MGYTTEFEGQIRVHPPLNDYERDFLQRFAGSRRMHRHNGPYFAEPGDDFGQARTPDIIDYNQPPPGQPSLWCDWVPIDDGAAIEWDGSEKFYGAEQWMKYIIDHFLKPEAHAQKLHVPMFEKFTFDHICNGEINAQGEDPEDSWRLRVDHNMVYVQRVMERVYDEPELI